MKYYENLGTNHTSSFIQRPKTPSIITAANLKMISHGQFLQTKLFYVYNSGKLWQKKMFQIELKWQTNFGTQPVFVK